VPQKLPEVSGARFAVHHRPGSRVGGDCFDVFRLDGRHTAFFLADVLGHGVTAGLLTLFLRRAFSSAELDPQAPEAALLRVNRLLLDQAGSDPPLVALVCGVLDATDGTLRWARAGLPPPLLVPASGPAQVWSAPGSLLGVCETSFAVQIHRLAPGDRLLLTSDGLDLAGPRGPQVSDRLLLSAGEHRAASVGAWLDHISQELTPETSPEDDWTMLAAEVVHGQL
jgi:sigma-B regulation protein RsbU (phosphoserine phosphatase)